jgi:cation transporter-like permease
MVFNQYVSTVPVRAARRVQNKSCYGVIIRDSTFENSTTNYSTVQYYTFTVLSLSNGITMKTQHTTNVHAINCYRNLCFIVYSTLMRFPLARACLFVVFIACKPSRARFAAGVSKSSSSSSMKSSSDASVLMELKETIRTQALQIQQLKKNQQLQAHSSRAPHHHHGMPTTSSQETSNNYLHRPFYQLAAHRVGWLSLFLVGLSATAVIINGFEHTLSRQIELAYFVPLLAGHGGNTGGQTVGTVLSALSSGAVHKRDAARVIGKEALSGFSVGLLLGSVVAPFLYSVMGISLHVSVVLFFTLTLVSTIAATLGSTIPFVCLALGLDPSVIAAPAMTSFVDVSGLLSYFLIANQIFKWFGLDL